MKAYYTKLGNLRALDINADVNKAFIKYLCSYESREKDLPILLYLIDVNENIKYYKEYYTGNIIISLDNPEKVYKELDTNVIDKKISNLPYLAVSNELVKTIDDEFIKEFYLNDQLNKIDAIILSIEHLVNKTKTNISNYILKTERIISFKCFEKAYLDNALYDLEKGLTYKIKRKMIDRK